MSHPLTRRQKGKALARFMGWQIRSRFNQGPLLVNWINGARFYASRRETGMTGNIYAGLHEFNDMAFILHVLGRNDMFMDVGANAGAYTLLACAVAGSSGVAFEPIPETYRRLQNNIALNCLENRVRCINCGVGKESGKLYFTNDGDTTNHVVGKPRNNSVLEVEVVSLDEFVTDTIPLIMKIDVEGYELPVIEGADRVLKDSRLKAVIMELNGSGHRYGFDESRIMNRMFKHGFLPYSYDPFTRTLNKLDSKNSEAGNTLFIRDSVFIEKRIALASTFCIFGTPV